MTAFCTACSSGGGHHWLWGVGYGAGCVLGRCWADLGGVAPGMGDCLAPEGLGLGWAVCIGARCSGSRLTGGGAGPLFRIVLGAGDGCFVCTGCGVGACGTYFLKYFLFRFVAVLEPLIMTV